MPQGKVYSSNAQRQAAYRKRSKCQRATQAELAALARSLHAVIQDAVDYSTFPLPKELAAARPDVTLRNLIKFLDPIYDPVRNPDGKHRRRSELFEIEEAIKNKENQGGEHDAATQNI